MRVLRASLFITTLISIALLFSCSSSSSPGSGNSDPITITIQKSGIGNGLIQTDIDGIECGSNCTGTTPLNTIVTLTAVPDSGSVFGGWSGDIKAGETPLICTVTMDQAKTVTASFSLTDTSSGLIQPESDFEYMGAFKLPDEQGADPNAKWNGGGHGMTFYPGGDPAGPSDGFSGSLFSISHTYANHVSEFSIPAPVISADKNLDDLPSATTLQTFHDITEGKQTLGLTGSTLVDIQYLPKKGSQTTDKLYWTMYEYYLPAAEEPFHGWAELDLSNPLSKGLWRLGDYSATATSKYLFDIPASWADTHTPGKSLAAGRFRIPNNGSWGPALYTFGPWNDGNPPLNGSSVAATELLKYTSNQDVRGFSYSDNWVDGAWLTSGSSSAVMIAGKRGLRTRISGLGTYGVPQPDDYSSSKGYHACPDYAAILFYDPRLLAHVAAGNLDAEAVQPYAVFNVQDYLFTTNLSLDVQNIRTRGKSIGGIGYDRTNNLIYMIEGNVEGYYSPGKPIVHVFKLKNSGTVADTIPPSVPDNMRVVTATSDTVNIAWGASSDNHHMAGYIVYRNGFPIDTVVAPEYTDDRVNPGVTYAYTVSAWDSRDNRSEQSIPLSATTPAGADIRRPLITDIQVTDITSTTAQVSWKTDEPATSAITYGAQYNANKSVSDPAMVTSHSLKLTGLTEAPDYGSYVYSISVTDAAGNTNTYPEKSFRTAKASGDNFAPVLSGIGARIIPAGSLLQFRVEGHDIDPADTPVFAAADLPQGAIFDAGTRIFSWTPETSQKGKYTITFSVSDGDQSDSEAVTVFVE